MKAQIISLDGKNVGEIELPSIFSTKIREDIIKKVFEAEKIIQPYGPNPRSGRQHSASGIIRHLRHVWKGGYGHGRSRVPRKIMWRRGTQFFWIGAEVSGTRGGRQAHPPKMVHIFEKKKINKKELDLAFATGFAGSLKEELVKKRYLRLKNMEIKNLPLVLELKNNIKAKELLAGLEKILGDLFLVAIPEKKVRAGKGKLRNRKYKKNAGVLLITGKDEILKTKIITHKKVGDVTISDLYPLGRLVIYTPGAIKELGMDNLPSKKNQTKETEAKK